MMLIHRRSGNVMVLVLAFIAVVGISLYFMIEYTLSQKRQTVKTENILDLKFAMDSAVDFVLFGIKQKYCFSDILMSDTNCDLNHNGSTERLIMSLEQVNFLLLANKITSAQSQTVRLMKITRDLEIVNVSSKHPLFSVLRSLQEQRDLGDIKYLHIEIERNDSPFLPRSGNEVYLNISVSLNKTLDSSAPITVANQKLQVISHLVIYPREVGSFALLVPKDMYLGSNDGGPDFGDTHFYSATSKTQFNGLQGLLFLSPVFVNRDIILNRAGYSPVTFAERVFMGSGKVLSGSIPYKPASNGGLGGRYWRETSTFGGFLRGLENDGALDAGLNAFIGNTQGTPPSDELMSKCIEQNLSQADLRKVLTSELAIQLGQNKGSSFNYLLKLSNSEFEGQNSDPTTNLTQWGTGTMNVQYDDDYRRTIMDATLKVGSRNASFSLSKDAKAVAVVQVGSIQYENRLRSELQQAIMALDTALANPDVSSDVIQTLRAAKLAAQDKLDQYLYKVAHPPKITINTEPVEKEHGVSKSKVNFNISIENPTHLLDANGTLANPEVSLKAYDSSYMEGGFIGDRHDAWRRHDGKRFTENTSLSRTLDFTINANNSAVVAPSGIPVATTADYEDLGDQCMNARDALESQAFGMAAAAVSFADATRVSWNFAGTGSETGKTKTDPLVSSLQFDGNNALAGANNTTFQVRSIVGTCTIKASANFVTGFFACNKLIIEQRRTPLRIIGTFIAGNVSIHPSAYISGITWSSIYHPQSTEDLRREGILKRTSNGGPCSSKSSSPIWSPVPSIQDVVDRMTCNVISLRAKADPFQWTSVDPDCGILPDKSNMMCKKRLVRFFVVEQAREGAR